jgi:hypothetical protein
MNRQCVRLTAGLDTLEKRKILLTPQKGRRLLRHSVRNLEYARVHKFATNQGASNIRCYGQLPPGTCAPLDYAILASRGQASIQKRQQTSARLHSLCTNPPSSFVALTFSSTFYHYAVRSTVLSIHLVYFRRLHASEASTISRVPNMFHVLHF